MNKTKQKGFSLIELLIVVTIIGIIVSIAVPNLYGSRRAANEASAVAALRVVNGGEITYQSTVGAGGYGTLDQLYVQRIIDSSLGTAPYMKSGYLFTLTPNVATGTMPATYDLTCVPQFSGGALATTGTRNFYTNESHVIYFSRLPNPPPGPTSLTDRTVINGLPLSYY